MSATGETVSFPFTTLVSASPLPDEGGNSTAPDKSKNCTAEEEIYLYSPPVLFLFTLLLLIIMLMALVGNILVITTILRNKNMRTRTNLLLCNLAVADVLVAVLDIPISIITLLHGKWPFSDHLCYFNGYLVGLGLMLSIHTLMWISIHKFISITRPLARSMTPGKIFCMILAAWLWALIYNLGPYFNWTETEHKRGASQCGPVVPRNFLQMTHSLANTLFNFLIPVCVMSYCYYKIFAEVKEHMNRLQDFSDTTMIMTIIQQRRITKTLVIVFLCFLLCWTPYIFYSCFLVLLKEDGVNPIFNPLAYLATYLNSACNPIIYGLRSPSFRRGFKDILSGCKDVPGVSNPRFETLRGVTPSGSFRWTRVNGFMISFRRSLIRTRSVPELATQKSKNMKKISPKNSSDKNELLSYIHRRINTVPKRKLENKNLYSVATNDMMNSPHITTQDFQISMETLNSPNSILSPKASISSPQIKVSCEENGQATTECNSVKNENIFFQTPTPKDKKYFIYSPIINHYNNHPFSVSAPNLLEHVEQFQNGQSVFGERKPTDENHLKLPENSYIRASSEGNVKPVCDQESEPQSSLHRKKIPKLVWQASIDNFYSNDNKLLHPQGFGGVKTDIPTIITSVENIFSNILITGSSRSVNSQMNDISKMEAGDRLSRTDDKKQVSQTMIQEEDETSILISHL